MHAKRERRLDRLFRVRCTNCDREVFLELFDDERQAAETEGELERDCAWCGPAQRMVVTKP